MKSSLLIFLALTICSTLMSQDIPDPEFSDRPYFLKENGLMSFERTDGTLEAKTSMKGMETFYAAFKAKSGVRFQVTSLPKMVIKTEGNADPAELFTVVKGNVTKDKRSFIQRKTDRKNIAMDIREFQIKTTFKKIRDNVYEIIFDNALTPGEYALLPSTESNLKIKISCFGID